MEVHEVVVARMSHSLWVLHTDSRRVLEWHRGRVKGTGVIMVYRFRIKIRTTRLAGHRRRLQERNWLIHQALKQRKLRQAVEQQ